MQLIWEVTDKFLYRSGNTEAQMNFVLSWKRLHKFVMDVKVIPGEEVALQHQLLVCDMMIDMRPKSSASPPHIQKCGSSEILKCVADSRKSSRHMCQLCKLKWLLLLRKSGRNSRQVCWRQQRPVVAQQKPHWWWLETWWWNNELDDTITAKQQAFKAWKSGKCTQASNNTAKCISRRAVHHTRHEADKVIYKGNDHKLSDIFRLANQMRKENLML